MQSAHPSPQSGQSEAYAKKPIESGNQVTKIVSPGQTHGTILYRRICSDGEDPAMIAGKRIFDVLSGQ